MQGDTHGTARQISMISSSDPSAATFPPISAQQRTAAGSQVGGMPRRLSISRAIAAVRPPGPLSG